MATTASCVFVCVCVCAGGSDKHMCMLWDQCSEFFEILYMALSSMLYWGFLWHVLVHKFSIVHSFSYFIFKYRCLQLNSCNNIFLTSRKQKSSTGTQNFWKLSCICIEKWGIPYVAEFLFRHRCRNLIMYVLN